MSDREQIEHFETELLKLVERFRCEYEISTAGAVGVLQMQAHRLIREAIDNSEE